MKAVNLMTADERHGVDDASGAARGGAYGILAVLAAAAVVGGALTITNRQIADRQGRLEQATVAAQTVQARAAALAPYLRFADLARTRVDTVTALSSTRFDWAHALREVSRVLPADVWLNSLDGSAGSSDAPLSAASSAAPAPTFELQGCTSSQADVARLMARLRAIDGVSSVELHSSAKSDSATGGGTGCGDGRAGEPQFTLAIAFAAATPAPHAPTAATVSSNPAAVRP